MAQDKLPRAGPALRQEEELHQGLFASVEDHPHLAYVPIAILSSSQAQK